MSTTKTNWRTDREQYTRSNATTARLLTLAALVKKFCFWFQVWRIRREGAFYELLWQGRGQPIGLGLQIFGLITVPLVINCRLTSPYGHLSITDSSFGPRNANIPCLCNTGTSVKRTLGSVPLVSALKSFDCMPCWGELKTLRTQSVVDVSVEKKWTL